MGGTVSRKEGARARKPFIPFKATWMSVEVPYKGGLMRGQTLVARKDRAPDTCLVAKTESVWNPVCK